MTERINQILGLILISLLIASCETKPFSDIDFSDSEYKLYCFTLPIDSSIERTNHFQEKYNNFFIDNISSLETIKNEIIREKTMEKSSSNYLYIFRLVKDGEILDGGILDVENSKFLYHNGKYEFDLEKFESFENNFKRLNSFEINCVTISNTKKFFDFIDNTTGFIYNNTKDGENPVIGFHGKIDLLTDTSKINMRNISGWEDIQKQILTDFKNIGEVRIYQFSYQFGDSILISMLWKKNFTSQIPKGYKVRKPYTDTIDLPLRVYNIEENEIINFFKQKGIKGYKINDLN